MPTPIPLSPFIDATALPEAQPQDFIEYARMVCAHARIYPGSISAEAIAICEEIRAYQDDPLPLFISDPSPEYMQATEIEQLLGVLAKYN